MTSIQPSSAKTTKNVFTIKDITSAVDLDGDGIEPDEKEILDVLKAMDVDGDGAISLKELVNLGSKLVDQKKEATTYKRMFWAVIVLVFVALMGIFCACLAAVEAGKDARPDTDGTLRTVVSSGATEVVGTSTHTDSVPLTELHKASYKTLRGINDLGFMFEKRMYQYTITGFEQDIGATGGVTVTLFTARGDTIVVAAAGAKLNRAAAGKQIDISAAKVQGGRKLLQTDAANIEFTQAAATSLSGTGEVSQAESTALQNAAAGAPENATDTAQVNPLAFTAPCNDEYAWHPSDKEQCKCFVGYKNDLTFDSDFGVYSGNCTAVAQPSGTACWLQTGWGDKKDWGANCECSHGYKGSIKWSEEDEAWVSTCVPVPAKFPNATMQVYDSRAYADTMGGMMMQGPWYWYSINYDCLQGYGAAGSDGRPWFDMHQMEWKGGCALMDCPAKSHRAYNSTGHITGCECDYFAYGPGFPWNGWEFDTSYYPRWGQMNYCWDLGCPKYAKKVLGDEMFGDFCEPVDGYTCAVTRNKTAADLGQWPMAPMSCEAEKCPGSSKMVRRTDPNTGKWETKCECGNGYVGEVAWNNSAWEDQCKPAPCPNNTTLKRFTPPVFANQTDYNGFADVLYCECDFPRRGNLAFDRATEGFAGSCEAVQCWDPKMTLDIETKECKCPPGFNGGTEWSGVIYGWVGTGCEPMKCPPGLQQEEDAYGPGIQCRCPLFKGGAAVYTPPQPVANKSAVKAAYEAQAKAMMEGKPSPAVMSVPQLYTPGTFAAACSAELTCPNGTMPIYDPEEKQTTCGCNPGSYGIAAFDFPAYFQRDVDEDFYNVSAPLNANFSKPFPEGFGGPRQALSKCVPFKCEDACVPGRPKSSATCATSSSAGAQFCNCPPGFRGEIEHKGGFKDNIHVSCNFVECPPGTKRTAGGTCACDRHGMQGTFTWNSTSLNYEGECNVIPCPAVSAGQVTTLPYAMEMSSPNGGSKCRCHSIVAGQPSSCALPSTLYMGFTRNGDGSGAFDGICA